MAKVSRSMLKSIVKECLVELLAEGLTGGDTGEMNESLSLKTGKKDQSFKATSHSLQEKVVNPNFQEKTKQLISQATKDPVMASILEDTAQTTLQDQNGADRPNQFTAKSSDVYSQAVSESDPMEMFGGVSNNWASLAFSNNKK